MVVGGTALTSTATTTATYDGTGLRASLTSPTSSGGTTTASFAYDESGSIPKVLGDGAIRYLYGPTGLLEQVPVGGTKSDVLFAHTDALGSLRALTSDTGTIVAMKTYGPYGKLVASSGSATSPIGFAGAYTDPDGLLYLVNRYYDPKTGQFLSVDPLVALTGEPYGYAGGDPLGAVDPSGLHCGPLSVLCAAYDATAGAVKGASYHVGRGVGNYYDTTTGFHARHTVGLCLNGEIAAGAALFGSACAGFAGGHFFTAESGGGGGGSPSLGASVGLLFSNATQPSDLGDPFAQAGASAAVGELVTAGADGSYGENACSRGIWGFQPELGLSAKIPGVPYETHAGVVNTWVQQP